jgi:hypothetical protein
VIVGTKCRGNVEEVFPVQLAGIVKDKSVLLDAEQEQFGALCKRLGLQEAN